MLPLPSWGEGPPARFPLRDPIVNDIAKHVGQAEISSLKTVGQFFVVDAHEVEDGRL